MLFYVGECSFLPGDSATIIVPCVAHFGVLFAIGQIQLMEIILPNAVKRLLKLILQFRLQHSHHFIFPTCKISLLYMFAGFSNQP